jgi:hemerythrin-like domain-containing protein
MKIKTGFVTNSSSTSYILSFGPDEFKDFQGFLEIMTNGIHMIKNPEEKHVKEYISEDQEYLDDFREAIDSNNTVVFVDVSDELGHALIECTKFSKNIVINSEEY